MPVSSVKYSDSCGLSVGLTATFIRPTMVSSPSRRGRGTSTVAEVPRETWPASWRVRPVGGRVVEAAVLAVPQRLRGRGQRWVRGLLDAHPGETVRSSGESRQVSHAVPAPSGRPTARPTHLTLMAES